MDDSTRLIVGAMSGTSADGVDAAVVSVCGRGAEMSAKLLAHHAEPYSPELRAAIVRLRGEATVSLRDVAQVTREITLMHAAAVLAALRRADMPIQQVVAVALHGQTLFHDPPCTMQVFDPSLLAIQLECPVVSDFRRADCAVGGQGAPLVPLADFLLFRSKDIHRALLNLGGIANITFLPRGCLLENVTAFDVGPANCLSDDIMRRHDPGGPGHDVGGALAMTGRANKDVAGDMCGDAFFKATGPKSTDGPAMIDLFQAALNRRAPDLSAPDQLATAAAIVVACVQAALTIDSNAFRGELIVSGGGVHNAAVMRGLSDIPDVAIRTTDDLGVPAAAKEAIAFALLGAATLDNMPGNLPSVTGATRPVVLGSITPAS
jgi:anhydro-N-acetylmuramic acid kinase